MIKEYTFILLRCIKSQQVIWVMHKLYILQLFFFSYLRGNPFGLPYSVKNVQLRHQGDTKKRQTTMSETTTTVTGILNIIMKPENQALSVWDLWKVTVKNKSKMS